MVQVLPYVQSPLEQLTPYISQAAGQIGQGFEQRSKKMAWERLITPGKLAQSTDQAGGNLNVMQQQAANQTAQSPLEQISSKPGGPSLGEFQAIISAAEAANPGSGKAVGDYLLNQKKSAEKEAIDIRKEARASQTAISQKKQEQDIGKRTVINEKRKNLKLALDSVRSGDVGAFGINAFADLFGDAGKRFKGVKAIQLDTATKGLLFDTLKDVTAKGTNLWLEKVAKTALPELGKSEEANETLISIAMANLDLEEKQLDIQDELSQKYIQANLPVPSNIEKLTNDLLKPYAEQVENKLAYDTRVIYEKEKGPTSLRSLEKVPKGTPLTREKRDALVKIYKGDKQKAWEKAQELGYVIPSPGVLEPIGGVSDLKAS